MECVRTALAGGSPLLQAGMVAALTQDPRITLTGQWQHPRDAVAHLGQQGCDVLVVNADVPHVEAAPVMEGLASSVVSTKVLIFTTNESLEEILDAFRVGVDGYGIYTALLPEDLCAAIIGLARSGLWICPRTARRLLDTALHWSSIGTVRGGPEALLSQRESEVLRLAANGAREDDIADALCLSRNTVKTYLRRIRDKLQADSRSAAVNLALERGLLPPRWVDGPTGTAVRNGNA